MLDEFWMESEQGFLTEWSYGNYLLRSLEPVSDKNHFKNNLVNNSHKTNKQEEKINLWVEVIHLSTHQTSTAPEDPLYTCLCNCFQYLCNYTMNNK